MSQLKNEYLYWRSRLCKYRMTSQDWIKTSTSCLMRRSSRTKESSLWNKHPSSLTKTLKVFINWILICDQNNCASINYNYSHFVNDLQDTTIVLDFCATVIVFIFIADLQDTTLVLDFRVTALEENGGSDGNSSVAELEVRVETLEGTAVDHETRISSLESDVNSMRVVNY